MFAETPEDTPTDAADLLRWGRIATVDLGNALCTVEIADGVISPPLPWFERSAGETRSWSPPSAGEQVMLLCPDGELAAGAILRGLNCDTHPELKEAQKEVVRFSDGASITYDAAARLLTIDLAGGTMDITADLLRLKSKVEISGNVSVDGKIEATEDVFGGGKSLKQHRHLGVTAGGGVSGMPQ